MIKYKILEEKDLDIDSDLFLGKENLSYFLKENNTCAFIAVKENEIIGFAYGYILLRPDGEKDFYMHSIDIIDKYQGKGYGTKLMNFILGYISDIGCRELFLITNKNNVQACKCYKKSGGITVSDDDIVYIFNSI